jgi:hypothetical protein
MFIDMVRLGKYLTICLALAGLLTAGVSTAFSQTSGTSGSSGFGTSGGTSGGFGSSSSGFGSSSSSSSTSFTGGTGGTSFTGGTSNPMSNSAGASGGGRFGGASGSGSYPGVSTNNPFYSYYVNPFAVGLPSSSGFTTSKTTKNIAFGTPLYTTTNNSNSMGTASISGANNQGYPGSNSIGTRRAPAYTTAVAFDITPVKPTVVQSDVQAMLNRSSKILSKDTIVVALDGDVLVLRGTAKDAHERRLAEALVRLTPGVRNVRNELAVPEVAPNPRPVTQ